MRDKIFDLQDNVKESAQKIWLAGLGAFTVAGEEGSKLFKTLVEKGEAFETQEDGPVEGVKKSMGGAKERAEDLWTKFESSFNDRVGMALEKLGVPTKDEIRTLTDRVDSLMEAINKLNVNDKEAKETPVAD